MIEDALEPAIMSQAMHKNAEKGMKKARSSKGRRKTGQFSNLLVSQPPNLPSSPSAPVVELFSGIQGEGTHVGRRQIFLRLAGCNLQCGYCDQPEARRAPARALIEQSPGSRRFVKMSNPLSAKAVRDAILRLHHPLHLHEALAVTGGEPLLHSVFLAALLPAVRNAGLPVFLETNGTRARELARLRSCVDIVSMDIKLRSATGRAMPSKAHEQFLRVASKSGAELYVKAVVASTTTTREIANAARMARTAVGDVPLILQPATRTGSRRPRPPEPALLLQLQEAALAHLSDVRVIPQTHRMMKQR